MQTTLLILAMAAVTYVYRYLPLAVLDRVALPQWALDWLDLVPGAVLAAMLVQAVIPSSTKGALTDPYLLAALPTVLVAWRTKSMILTMATGMAAFALLSRFLA